tara:strand:+ start:3455 stop:3649 length:195 start_codon:yes stop_codon:yes gene_type:complete
MQIKVIVLGMVEATCWYLFFWFGLHSIKRGYNSWWAAAVLLILFYAAFVTCPWIREMDAWSQLK